MNTYKPDKQPTGFSVVTDAASEPVTKAEVKLQLNRDSSFTAHDDILDIYIKAARQLVEQRTNTAMIQKTIDVNYSGFPGRSGDTEGAALKVPVYPLASVTSITYIDDAGASQTLAGANYIIDTKRGFPRIHTAYNALWPTTQNRANPVTVRCVVGYATTAIIPAYLRTAVLMTVAQWYWNREDYVSERSTAVDRILAQERVFEF